MYDAGLKFGGRTPIFSTRYFRFEPTTFSAGNRRGLSEYSRRPREAPAVKFDFRRPDRIPKSQVRAIHLLHDTFVRNVVSSLSAYLRSYLTVNLVSVEQFSYSEFLDGLPSPTCMVSLGLSPYDGNGVLELNPSLVFPILEMLLGAPASRRAIQRDITEIEQKLLDGLFRIILHDLREAWKGVTEVDFTIESMETEPQLLHILAPNEAVVSIGVEIRIGETVGMMNIALPSIVIKMMRQKFDQQWSVRKTHASQSEQLRVLRSLRDANLTLEARLEGQTVSLRNLLGWRRQPAEIRFPGRAVHRNAGQRAAQVFRTSSKHGQEESLPDRESNPPAVSGKDQRRRRRGRGGHF